MRNAIAGLLLSVLGATLSAGPTLAAVDVALAVSPSQGTVGHPVEVLLRTFTPQPLGDVAAQADDGSTISVSLTRDPSDATLWRGTFTPTKSGEWTIQVRNFPAGTPGASARLVVTAGDAVPAACLVSAAALLIGLIVGAILGRRGISRWARAT